MVTITIKTEEEGQGEGEGLPGIAQGKKKRGIAAEETMLANHVDTVRRSARSDSNVIMGMEESYPVRWAVAALVPFAKGRDPGTMGGELQESSGHGQQDVTT